MAWSDSEYRKNYFAAYHVKNKERRNAEKLNRYVRRYGLKDHAEYKTVTDRPCQICGESKVRMVIDHVKPDSYRDVLCVHCNVMLGWFEQHKNETHNYLTCWHKQSKS